jgi:hypothetical protein
VIETLVYPKSAPLKERGKRLAMSASIESKNHGSLPHGLESASLIRGLAVHVWRIAL